MADGDDQRDQHADDEEAGSAHRSLRGSTTAPSDRIEGTHRPDEDALLMVAAEPNDDREHE